MPPPPFLSFDDRLLNISKLAFLDAGGQKLDEERDIQNQSLSAALSEENQKNPTSVSQTRSPAEQISDDTSTVQTSSTEVIPESSVNAGTSTQASEPEQQYVQTNRCL